MIAVLAGAHARFGYAEKARGGLALARELAALRRSPFWDPEVERLEGELALLGPTPATAEAEGHFARALELADELGARSLALRAATSLARLLQRDGRRAEAAAILAPRYEGFSEGWDTADLRTARALLDALA
jgi:adenylate cyclase